MTFLTGLLASLIEWLIVKLANLTIVEVDRLIEKIKLEATAKSDAKALKDAKTEDAQKAALDHTIDDTFK